MATPSAPERIMTTAERLIAERGAAVSLRDIATEAGQRNNSAVHYHFGSRDGLVRAIVERRQGPMEARRVALLAELERDGRGDDLPSLVEILVLPLVETAYADGATHYGRFLERVREHPVVAGARQAVDGWPSVEIVATRLERTLADLPPATRARRLSAMATVLFGLLADAERRAEEAGRPAPAANVAEVTGDIVDMLVGMLTAPARRRVTA